MWQVWESSEKRTMSWLESPKERDHSEDQGINGWMGSECIVRKLARGCRVDSVGSGYSQVAGCCEYGDEPSGSNVTELFIRTSHCED
jgi:hypothetical protein